MKMLANYHTHTSRCRHASGTEREYIEEALKGGLKILGFSDHSPMPFPGDYSSGMRMDMNELEDYCDTLTALKKEYEKDIEIHIGLEAEYYPLYFDKLLQYLSGYPVEYLICGQHWLGSEYYIDEDGNAVYEHGSGRPTKNETDLKRYIDQVIEAIDTGKFLYIAHPDIINFQGDEAIYISEVERLCRHAADADIPLEINLLGIEDGRDYPREAFWKVAGKVGNRVILGADAHMKERVAVPEAEAAALRLAEGCGLRVIKDNVLLCNSDV